MSLKFTSACSMHFPKPLNQRISPGARERYGGNVPLIGFASWARTENEEDLVVEKGLFNPGFDIKPPVRYTTASHHHADGKGFLDPNHSHFILVVNTNLSPDDAGAGLGWQGCQ